MLRRYNLGRKLPKTVKQTSFKLFAEVSQRVFLVELIKLNLRTHPDGPFSDPPHSLDSPKEHHNLTELDPVRNSKWIGMGRMDSNFAHCFRVFGQNGGYE